MGGGGSAGNVDCVTEKRGGEEVRRVVEVVVCVGEMGGYREVQVGYSWDIVLYR